MLKRFEIILLKGVALKMQDFFFNLTGSKKCLTHYWSIGLVEN